MDPVMNMTGTPSIDEGVRTKAVEGTGGMDMRHSLDHLRLNWKERFPRGADTWVGY